MIVDNDLLILMDDNSINSSSAADMRTSITHSKGNKITLDNISSYYVFDNKIKFGMNFLRKYEHIFKQYYMTYTIEEKYFYRPEYISYLLYETTDLWYLLLFINNMTRPDEFNKNNIIIFDPSYLSVFNDIIEKEKNSINNMSNPTVLERETVRDLNQPSKRILSSRYDKKISPLNPPEKPKKLTTITDFVNNFKDIYSPIMRGKLLKKIYKITDNTGKYAMLTNTIVSNKLRLDDNCDTGFPISFGKNYRQLFEGYIFIDNEDEYEFKPIVMGNCKLNIDDKQVINTLGENFTINENIFETQTKNSDFKTGSTDGWEVLDGELIKDNDGKNILKKVYEKQEKGSNIAKVNLDVSLIKTYRDLAITTTYKSIDNGNLLFSGASVTVEYTDNTKIVFENNKEYAYFNNNANFTDSVIIVTFIKGKTLKNITIDFPVERKPMYNELLNGEVNISQLKVQPVLYDSAKIKLSGNRWHKFKLQYDMIEQPSSYLQLLLKGSNDTQYKNINESSFAFSPDGNLSKNEQKNTILNVFYDINEEFIFTQEYLNDNNFSYDDINPINGFIPQGINYTIRQYSKLKLVPNTKYKIQGNRDDVVQIYMNDELILEKSSGIDDIYTKDIIATKEEIVDLLVVYKHFNGNGKAFFNIKSLPDKYNNPDWGLIDNKGSILIPSSTDWKGTTNSVILNDYSSGLNNYYFTGDDRGLSDYRLKVMVKGSKYHQGNLGVIFRMQGEDEYYLYTIRRKNIDKGIVYPMLSGLYKISPKYSEIDISSDGLHKVRGKLLSTTEQTYLSDENNCIFIMMYHNRIRIYDKVGGYPIIDFTDTDSPLLDGSFGFSIFNQSNVEYTDIEISY